MSLEQNLREVVRNEVNNEIGPLKNKIDLLAELAQRLAPIMGLTAVINPSAAPAQVAPPVTPRRRGRPPGSKNKPRPAKAVQVAVQTMRTRGAPTLNNRPCAIIGCKHPAKSKGYCVAHYQKARNLKLSNRLPATWTDFAPPHSVQDVQLLRGRAAVKAKALGRLSL